MRRRPLITRITGCGPCTASGLLGNGPLQRIRYHPCSHLTLWLPYREMSHSTPPPPFSQSRQVDAAAQTSSASSSSLFNDTTVLDTPASTPPSVSTVATPFSAEEMRALVLPLIPCVPSFPPSSSPASLSQFPPSISVTEVHRHLPKALRSYMERYRRPAGSSTHLRCFVWDTRVNGDAEKSNATAAALLSSGIGAFLVDHFPREIAVVMPGGRLVRREAASPQASTAADVSDVKASFPSPGTLGEENTTKADSFEPFAFGISVDAVEDSQSAAAASPSLSSLLEDPHTMSNAVRGTGPSAEGTAPPPPPQPQGPSQRYGSGAGGASFFGGSTGAFSGGAASSSLRKTSGGTGGEADAAPLRTTIQMLDVLVEFIPTFYVSVDSIAPTIPSTLQQQYSDTSLRFFLKRFRHYIDMRTSHNATEVRLKTNFEHPKRGMADARYRAGGLGEAEVLQSAHAFRRPPRNSEANLIGLIAPQVPKTFAPLADVLQEIAPIVSRHPAFDTRIGVTGLLGKYPEYFQVVDGKLRARPYREAPNSLKDLDQAASPLPHIYAKVLAAVEEAAVGKNYAEPSEKVAAMVSTGRLYSRLTAQEKAEVKQKCRSFPTFLRLHGKDLVVSVDKMRVYKFVPEYEVCVDTLMDERLRMNSLDPNDPVLKIPAEMAAEANAEWAVRELYDALPLMQCAELDEVLSLVPPAVRDALPKEMTDVQALLSHYDEYFTMWPYPDDERVIVVQRAKVEQPVLAKADIVRLVVPLIPQGGTTLASLRTRAPLLLQRYFYRHGTVATLSAMKDIFAIAGERIVRLV